MAHERTKGYVKPPENAWGILKRILGYMKRDYLGACIAATACMVVASLATVQGLVFLKQLVDVYIIPLTKVKNPDFTPLFRKLVKLALLFLGGAAASWVSNYITVRMSQGIMRDIRMEMFSHMETLPVGYFDSKSHGDIMSLYTNDVDTMKQLLGQNIPRAVQSFFGLLFTLISMFTISMPLTVESVIMAVVMIAVITGISKKSGIYFKGEQQSMGELNGYIEEQMTGQKIVKSFCHEEESLDAFDRMNEKLYKTGKKAGGIAGMTRPVTKSMGNLSFVICAATGAWLALRPGSAFTIGALVSFLSLNRNFTGPISNFSMLMNSIMTALAGADRIFRLLDRSSESDTGTVTLEKNTDGNFWNKDGKEIPLRGEVEFDNVDFSYGGESVLKSLSFKAEPGMTVAIVGSTGAGKTTIVNLLNRFYDIKKGSVMYDGISISDIKKADLRQSLGMVLQDVHLFTGSIMENIRFGRLDATDEECMEAAKSVSAHEFIKHLPDGYDTVLTNNGSNLSQGQRQLISIARAAVANPPVLIMDEPTSSVDTRTERFIGMGLEALMKSRTAFVIAHRLSTIKNADLILVLERGHIEEKGTHGELIDKKGRYSEFYNGNTEGEL